MSNNIQNIKERLGIVEVVGDYLKLEKAGINFKAHCPFHNEKTPSFFVSPDRGTYKCFGCGVGGDIFTFVEQFEGVDFLGALKILANKAGVEIKKENPKKKEERSLLYNIMNESLLFFEKKLQSNEEVLNYLKKRGLTLDTINKFRIGFIDNNWQDLHLFLKNKGFSDDSIERAGLIKKTKQSFYDRFRGRIIFPIFDNSNQVIAFSGRIYKNDGKSAKYINSPETVLFNKSEVLYGFNFAKQNIRKRGFFILVEGQMDVIMAHQEGFTNTIATSGTSLTTSHLALLKRVSNKVMLAFDGDKAGLVATNRGAKMILSEGMDVKLIEIPNNSDPADFILKDKKGWFNALKNSVHIIDFNLNILKREVKNQREFRHRIEKDILPLIFGIKSKIEQDYFISHIASNTKIPKTIIEEELKKIAEPKTQPSLKKDKIEPVISRKERVTQEIFNLLCWQNNIKNPTLNTKKEISRFEEITGINFFEKSNILSNQEKDTIFFEMEILYENLNSLNEKTEDLFKNLEKEFLIEKRERVLKKIRKGDDTLRIKKEFNELSKKIEQMK